MGLPLSGFSLMGQGRMRQVNASHPIHQHCSVLVPRVAVAYHSCPYCTVAMLCRLQVPHSPHSPTLTHTDAHWHTPHLYTTISHMTRHPVIKGTFAPMTRVLW